MRNHCAHTRTTDGAVNARSTTPNALENVRWWPFGMWRQRCSDRDRRDNRDHDFADDERGSDDGLLNLLYPLRQERGVPFNAPLKIGANRARNPRRSLIHLWRLATVPLALAAVLTRHGLCWRGARQLKLQDAAAPRGRQYHAERREERENFRSSQHAPRILRAASASNVISTAISLQ
jgi:hypothetical protein